MRFYSVDPAEQGASPYLYCGNNPILYVDENGEWFLIDDLIVAAVSFTAGYVSHGIETGEWGEEALVHGAISAACGWLAYNTAGMAAAATGFNPGTLGHAMTMSVTNGAVGGATSSIGTQLYEDGSVNWNEVGYQTLLGTAGGITGGLVGYGNGDMVLPGIVGGATTGAIDGARQGGLVGMVQGMFMGAGTGFVSSVGTAAAYNIYGDLLTRPVLGDNAYGTDYAGTPKHAEEQLKSINPDIKQSGYQAFWNPDKYDCQSFVQDMHQYYGDRLTYLKGNGAKHYAIPLGYSRYGQRLMLNKGGADPTPGHNVTIHVTTQRQLPRIYGLMQTIPAQDLYGNYGFEQFWLKRIKP